MANEIELMKPNRKIIKAAVEETLKEGSDFKIHDDLLNKLFKKHKKNDDFEKVLLKVVALNTFYSAGIKNIHITNMAKHIVDVYKEKKYVDKPCNILSPSDQCLGLVNELAKIEVKEKDKNDKEIIKVINHYSFASKFCFFQNNEFFFIYDSYVDELLFQFQKKLKNKYKEKLDKYTEFTRGGLRNYKTFYSAINQFITVFELQNGSEKLTNREIDIYLWSYGKKIKEEKSKKAKAEKEKNKLNLE